MSDSYTREDLDEEVNKVMEDNTEQDLSTVNDSELTIDTEADNNKGKKKKAQNLVISCSSKFDFGKSGLSELFLKLGSDGNYEFKQIENIVYILDEFTHMLCVNSPKDN